MPFAAKLMANNLTSLTVTGYKFVSWAILMHYIDRKGHALSFK